MCWCSVAHWPHHHLLTHTPPQCLTLSSLVSPQQQTFALTKYFLSQPKHLWVSTQGCFKFGAEYVQLSTINISDRSRPEVRSSCERRWSQRGKCPAHTHYTSARLRLAAGSVGWLMCLVGWHCWLFGRWWWLVGWSGLQCGRRYKLPQYAVVIIRNCRLITARSGDKWVYYYIIVLDAYFLIILKMRMRSKFVMNCSGIY